MKLGSVPNQSGKTASDRLPFWLMVFVVWVTFALRVMRLDDLPQALSLDESIDGLDALQLVRWGWLTPFLQNNFGRETLFLYFQGVVLHIWGISAFALRFGSVVMGTLTIPLLAAVARQLASRGVERAETFPPKYIGLLAATGMAVCYWHIYFSRQALRAIALPPILLAGIWCLWRAYRTTLASSGKAALFWWSMAGFLLGLTLYTYTAARLVLLLVFLLVGMWLVRQRSHRGQMGWGLAVLLSVIFAVCIPLLLYFVRNPHAFSSRLAAVSLPMDSALPATLGENLSRLLIIHFGAGSWVGNWPSLNAISGLGLLIGLLVCVRRSPRPAAWWLIAWWMVGLLPVLLSRQDWDAVTTILRGILAWPALQLISAVGLAALTRWCIQRFSGRTWERMASEHTWLALLPASVLLAAGGISSAYNYFSVWANNIDPPRNQARVVANYLNGRTGQLTLTPNRFYTNPATRFLLQARYPILDSLSFEDVAARIAAHRFSEADEPAVVCIMPRDGSVPSAWVLLEPHADGTGTAHLLPQLAPTQATALTEAVRVGKPLLTLTSSGEAVADVYSLDPGARILPESTEVVQPLRASFGDDLLLLGFRVDPEQAKPGERVSLWLRWQSVRPIDGDYDLFIHLSNLSSEQRIAQINKSLGSSILLHSHFWPPGLVVQDLHPFDLPSDAPDGVYRFEVGLYHRASGQRLDVQMAGGAIPTDSITLGKLWVRTQPPPAPALALNVPFEDNIFLRGVDAHTTDEGLVQVVLHWQATGVIAHDYTVFIHLLDAQGHLVAQQDNMPLRGHYPTSLWSPEEMVIDTYWLHLPPGMPDGCYALRVGLYDLPTGRRLQPLGQDRDFVEVALQRVGGRFHPSRESR